MIGALGDRTVFVPFSGVAVSPNEKYAYVGAGNDLTHIGGYGNAESMGPDSPVIDPKTGKIRPRRQDDSKDLKSPFANPEIAFAWLVGIGVTDKYIYTGDSLNRRMMRLKTTYVAEETCEIK